MKIASLISLFVSVALLGCSASPTVHLNTLYLDDNSAETIKVKLEEEGFNVEFNQLDYPADVSATSIVYSPFVNDNQAVDKVAKVLDELDVDVESINSLVSSNHWYTKNTLGLFVVPKGMAINTGTSLIDLAKVYKSSECERDIEINLKSNGTFVYSENGNEKLKGIWSITGFPYILLEKKEPYLNYYFEVEMTESHDQISKVNITSLKPVSSDKTIKKCTVSYGIRA